MHEPQICAVVSAMETRHKNRKYIHKNGSNRKFKKEGPQEKISKFWKKVPSLLPLKSGPKKKSHPHLLPPPPFPCARAIYPFTLKLPPYTPYATSYPPPPFPRHLLKNQAKYREGNIVNHENHKSLLLNCTESKRTFHAKITVQIKYFTGSPTEMMRIGQTLGKRHIIYRAITACIERTQLKIQISGF